MGELSPEELLGRLREGDRAALEQLYQLHFLSLWRLAAVMTQDPDAAEDIVQDVFLSVWARRTSLEVRGDFRVYLSSAVRHMVYRHRMHGRVVSESKATFVHTPVATPGLGQSQATPDRAVEATEFTTAYERVIAVMTERDRIAVRLRWEDGFTFAQIGQILGMTAMGARGVVLRAQQKVQDALAIYRS